MQLQKQRKSCKAELIHSRLTSVCIFVFTQIQLSVNSWTFIGTHARVSYVDIASLAPLCQLNFLCYIIIYLMIIFVWGSSYLILLLEIVIVLVLVFALEIPWRSRSKIYTQKKENIMWLWNGLTDFKISNNQAGCKPSPVIRKFPYWPNIE